MTIRCARAATLTFTSAPGNTASSRWRTRRYCMAFLTSIWAGSWNTDISGQQRGLQMANRFKRVMVTGGAGYVGSNLVPKLLDAGCEVSVLDLYLYGDDLFGKYASDGRLREVKGDLRDPAAVA